MTKRERQRAKQAGLGESRKEDPGASTRVLAWDPIVVCGGGSEFQIVDQPKPEPKPNWDE